MSDHPTLRFGGFELDLANRRLTGEGEEVSLGSRYFDALALLAAHPQKLIAKDRFMSEVWRGIPVTDEALTQCIRSLRRALGDDAGSPRFIETVPRHGYRFVCEVEEVASADMPGPVASFQRGRSASRIAGATTLGGLAAGILGGLFYGVFATNGGGGSLVAVLLLSAMLGLLGAAGIGLGMALSFLLGGNRWWMLPLGGLGGGALVGALGAALSVSGLRAITGQGLEDVTGLFEGATLGLAAGLAVAATRNQGAHSWIVATTGAIAGALAGGAIVIVGGRLLGSSLAAIEERFPEAQIDSVALAALFGQNGFHMHTVLATAIGEGTVFVCSIVLANYFAARQINTHG